MDPNQLLAWYAGASAILFFVRSSRTARSTGFGWLAVAGVVIASLFTLMEVAPAAAGWIGAALWTVLGTTPMLLQRAVAKRSLAQRYPEAQRWSLVARIFHPLDGWWHQPALFRALELAQRGAIDEATATFARLENKPGVIGRIANLQTRRLREQWAELAEWVERSLGEKAGVDPSVVVLLARAYGELGDVEKLTELYERAKRSLEQAGLAAVRAQVWLMLFAFTGRKTALEHLFAGPVSAAASPEIAGPLAGMPPRFRQFWVATAELAAGDVGAAHDTLRALAVEGDAVLSNGVARRLDAATPIAGAAARLSPDALKLVEEAEREAEQERRYRPQLGGLGGLRARRATIALIAANLAVFAVELSLGGSTDMRTLYELGAMVPSEVFAGAAWRLVTSTFLHFGALHLLVNMFGLLFFGAFVEKTLGPRRFLLLYFGSGIGSMFFIAVTYVLAGSGERSAAVGASGAIMGLFGAAIAVFRRGWQQERARVAKKLLLQMLAIALLQVAFDLLTPEVSFLGHAGGIVLGYALGARLLRRSAP